MTSLDAIPKMDTVALLIAPSTGVSTADGASPIDPQHRWRKWRSGFAAGAATTILLLAAGLSSVGPTVHGHRGTGVQGADTDSVVELANAKLTEAADAERRANAIVQVMTNRSLAETKNTVQKALAWVSRNNVMAKDRRSRKIYQATCAMDVIDSLNFLAFFGLSLHAMAVTCQNAQNQAMALGNRSLAFDILCGLNGVVAGFSVARAGASLTFAVAGCTKDMSTKQTVQIGCASSILAVISVLDEIGISGWLVFEACREELFGMDPEKIIQLFIEGSPEVDTSGFAGILAEALGPELSLRPGGPKGRRLFLGAGPENFLGQCVVGVVQMATSVSFLAFALISAMETGCTGGAGPGSAGIQPALCTMDISAIIFTIASMALNAVLSIILCVDSIDLRVFCAAGVTGLIHSASGLMGAIAGIYVCDQLLPQTKSPMKQLKALAKPRRLAGGGRSSVGERVLKLARRYGFDDTNVTRKLVFKDDAEALGALRELAGILERPIEAGETPLQLWDPHRFNASAHMARPLEPRLDRERFVQVMEPALSPEAHRQVEELAARSGADGVDAFK